MQAFRNHILRAAFILLFLSTFNTGLLAQQKSKTIDVYVTRLNDCTRKMNDFLVKNQCVSFRTELSTQQYYCQFQMPMLYMDALDSMANAMGWVTRNNFNTENYQMLIRDLEQKNERMRFENNMLYNQLNDTLQYANRNNLRERINNNNMRMSEQDLQINAFKQASNDSTCMVNFYIHDDLATPNNSKVSFVNMPGVEYGVLLVENPKYGVSCDMYAGPTIKYMFTRGKSYFDLGVYKGQNNDITDTSRINELFMIEFGQDFYPRNFGRGKRTFFNLYTGYQIGGFITNQNNEKNSKFMANVDLSFGVELVKTKHILLDTKASYFLPLSDVNRNLRGMLLQASFNFVF